MECQDHRPVVEVHKKKQMQSITIYFHQYRFVNFAGSIVDGITMCVKINAYQNIQDTIQFSTAAFRVNSAKFALNRTKLNPNREYC